MSETKNISADKHEDVKSEFFLKDLFDNGICPHQDGTIDLYIRPERSVKKIDNLSSARSIIKKTIQNIYEYQEQCWNELLAIINKIMKNNDKFELDELTQYYKSECIELIENMIKSYGKSASELVGIPQFLEKTGMIDIDMILGLYDNLNKIALNNYLIRMENYRMLLLHILEKMITKTTKKTAGVDSGVMGPYAHLDLPMLERVTPWELIGEGLQGRQDEIRSLTRYNPEYLAGLGVYGVFWEPRRWPYAFNDLYRDDGVYPTRVNLRH